MEILIMICITPVGVEWTVIQIMCQSWEIYKTSELHKKNCEIAKGTVRRLLFALLLSKWKDFSTSCNTHDD